VKGRKVNITGTNSVRPAESYKFPTWGSSGIRPNNYVKPRLDKQLIPPKT
jgi:hypothetical protein